MAELIAIEVESVEFRPLYNHPLAQASAWSVVAALRAAPAEVREDVFEGACPESAYASLIRGRNAALSRSTELQSQRDAIATELRSIASALGLSTDDTIESLAARCRTAVALGSIGDLRRRAEKAERELKASRLVLDEAITALTASGEEADVPIRIGWLARERDSANARIKELESYLEMEADHSGTKSEEAASWRRVSEQLQSELECARNELTRLLPIVDDWPKQREVVQLVRIERDSAIRDRDDAQSARDVATSELALAKECVRNLEEEINKEVARRVLSEDALRDCVHKRDRLQRELAEARQRHAHVVFAIEHWDAVVSEAQAAFGKGDGVLGDGVFSAANFANAVARLSGINGLMDGAVVRQLAAGRLEVLPGGGHFRPLPVAGVPRERVREMIGKAWVMGNNHECGTGNILADYDREKGAKP